MNKFIIITLVLIISGCASMYPGTLDQNTVLENNSAILLVGIKGKYKVNYIQYCHSKNPCMNFRFEATTNDVIAMPIKVPINELELNTITFENSYGFRGVDDKPLSISKSGVYYHLTIDTDNHVVRYKPDAELLQIAKMKYEGLIGTLPTVNFNW